MPWHTFRCISCVLVIPVGYAKGPPHGDTGIRDIQVMRTSRIYTEDFTSEILSEVENLRKKTEPDAPALD